MTLRCLIILLCCHILLSSRAQSDAKYVFHHIDHKNGLLADDVRTIAQDDKGYIWISTRNYLQRYDGLRFTSYPGYRARNDNIKMILQKYDSYSGANNQIWLVASNYKFYYDSLVMKKPGNAYVFRPDKLEEEAVLAYDKIKNETWAAAGYDLLWIDEKAKKIYSHDYNPLENPLLRQFTKKNLRSITMDSRKNLWITAWSDSFYRYDPVRRKLSTYVLSTISKTSDRSLLVNFIFEDNHDVIWIGTEKAGLMRYNRDADDFDLILSDEKSNQSIQYNYDIYCIFQDREENIWIGTDKGISIFNPYHHYFQIIKSEPGNSSSLPQKEITSFIETRSGNFLVGTWGGGFTLFDHNLHFKRNFFFNSHIPEENLTWSFIQCDDTTVWIGCQHGYLHIYNPQTMSVSTLHPPEFHNSTILCMVKDRTGNIWFGLYNGQVAKWDENQKKFYSCNDISRPTHLLFPVSNILIDHQQNFWVATEKGFNLFDPEKRIFTKAFLTQPNISFSIPDERCSAIEEYNDDSLLVGTATGLNFFNKKTGKLSTVTLTGNLPLHAVHAIKRDGAKDVWFTTDYNLYNYNPGVHRLVACNVETDILRSPFSATHFYITHDGYWVTFTEAEIAAFFPENIEREVNLQPTVTVTGFKVFDKLLPIDSILRNNESLRLTYKQNFFNIEFSDLRFSNFVQTSYSYQLKGVDKDWVRAGAKQSATYTKLDPGDYRFLVKADSGLDEGKITSLQIIITPPFWRTTWFKILCSATLVLFFYTAVRWRIKSIRKEEANKLQFNKQIAEMEMKALRAQMNPHFIFNCINSIDALIQSNDKYHATIYLNKFAKLIRNILDSSKENTIALEKDLETLQLYIDLEQFRNENKFTSEIKTDSALMQEDCKVPPLIIQPFVENAILHGLRKRRDNNGKLNILITKSNGHIKYIIEDNGVGRMTETNAANNQKSSYGMQMSEDRIKLFNQEEQASVKITDIKNDNDRGTKIEVLLKIQ